MIYASITLMIVTAIGLGTFQADEHSLIIRYGYMSAKIKQQWLWFRAIALGLACGFLYSVGMAGFLSAVALFVASWCLYTYVFRKGLNRARGWDPNYMGSTSVYDVFMIRFAYLLREWRLPCRQSIISAHQDVYKLDKDYRRTVHLAGKIAGSVEMASFAMFVLCAILCG